MVICTDGLANKGIGIINTSNEEVNPFYEKVGEYALSKGVSISVLTIKGDS